MNFSKILNKTALIILLVNLYFTLGQSINLSEIMFVPSAVNSEFIEIKNISNTETINLTGFKIQYSTSSPDEIISLSDHYDLLPDQYAVIFEADYNFQNGIYKDLISGDCLKFVLDDNAFGSSGMANTSDRIIYLLNSENDTLDSYKYSADNEVGISDERISFGNNEWGNSQTLNGTPGFQNSISKKEFDLAVVDFLIEPQNVILGNSAEAKIIIKNLGTHTASDFLVNLFKDNNQDSIPQFDELISTHNYSNLDTASILSFNEMINNIVYGLNRFIIQINYPDDENNLNNMKLAEVYGIEINEKKGDLVINEIMYAPKSPEPEWFEIYNRSEKNILIKNYKIADNSDTVNIKNQPFLLFPNQYLVISDDSTISDIYPNLQKVIVVNFPTLNNTNDEILIMDSLSRIIDSVAYTSNLGGGNGSSLERINFDQDSNNPGNWKSSKYPTPGKLNSISKKEFDIEIDTAFVDTPNAIIGDSVNVICKIKNIGKHEISFILNLSEQTNYHEIEVDNSEKLNLSPDDSIFYAFKNKIQIDSFTKCYFLKIVVNDDDTANNYFSLSVYPGYPESSIIVNEIMFYPNNDEPEWIELYNNSEYEINLKNWRIGDVLSKPVFANICDSNIFIEPLKYLVITKEASIYNYHKMILSPTVTVKFANLNNDVDGIVIKDNRGITIDSVLYKNDWGKKGDSIERKSKKYSSNNKNNWGRSIDIEGSTPGRVNSVSSKNVDVSVVKLFSSPNFPVKNEYINLNIIVKNYGEQKAENGIVKFYYGKLVPDQLLEEISIISIDRGDSIQITSVQKIKISDTLKISAQIDFDEDEDIVNNYLNDEIIPGFDRNTLLINEIMFKVDDDMPEWIELYNNADTTININNWLICNGKLSSIITQENILIDPGNYFIISDFTFKMLDYENTKTVYTDLPDLNDKNGKVIIYDYRKAVIDSMQYEVANNFLPNISLERISLETASSDNLNWTSSLNSNGSTPGKENSIKILPDNEYGDVIFSEIMFDPDANNSEYLEIFNRSGNSLELGNWKIKVDDNLYSLSEYSYNLEAGGYFVLSSDSLIYQNYGWLNNENNIRIANTSSLNLTNSGKTIFLIDYKNRIIDSLSYSESWHNSAFIDTKNISLELINMNLERNKSSNWSSSVSGFGGTPLRQNSIFVEQKVTETKLNISPNPFSPDNDGFEDFTIISYNLKEDIVQIRARIFDSKGRLVRYLSNNIPSGSKGDIIFNGLDENGNPLKIGIYIILFEAVNLNNAVVEKIKDVVVVARKF